MPGQRAPAPRCGFYCKAVLGLLMAGAGGAFGAKAAMAVNRPGANDPDSPTHALFSTSPQGCSVLPRSSLILAF